MMKVTLFALLATVGFGHAGHIGQSFAQTSTTATPRVARVTLAFPGDRDNFYYVIAMTMDEPELCERINPIADGGGGGWLPPGFQVRTMQSSCYMSLAARLHQPSLCDHVVAVIDGPLDGSKQDSAYCRAQREPLDIAVPNPHNMEPFVRQLRALGYGDRDVADAEYNENPGNSTTHAAYDQLRANDTFLQRLRSAQSDAEPRDRARLRAAAPLEFLYQMVAVDGKEPGLCARISPNATYTDLSERTALLHSRCYVYLAHNMRDATLCEPLPRARTFPHINEIYDSFERCQETVAIYRRPDFNDGGLHSGPSEFPHAADFEAALRQLGYPPEYVGTLVPKPPAGAYWEFVSRLKFRGPAADRNEFVRRVKGLR